MNSGISRRQSAGRTRSTSSQHDEPNVVLGCQRPRVSNLPKWVSSSGEEAVQLAGLAGLVLDDWQQFVLLHALGERADGSWSAPTVGLIVGRQNGKGPHALDTPILTTDGWTTFADIAPGQSVYGADGDPTRVIARSEVFLGEDCCEVEFTDGAKYVVGDGHLWRVRCKDRQHWEVRSTAELAPSVGGRRSDNGRMEYRWRVRCDAVPRTPEIDLPIDPYIFGYWLGDGISSAAAIVTGHEDREYVRGRIVAAGYTVTREELHGTRRAWTLCININEKMRDGFESRCKRLGVWGKKRIPDIYLRASVEQRKSLLAGLMDSDGSIAVTNRSPQVELSSSFPRLAEDITRLLRSLGVRGRAYRGKTTRRDRHRFLWTPAFNPFEISRKAEHYRPPLSKRHELMSITAIRRVPSVPVRCIQVEASDGVYLVGHQFTPTHNSILEARELAGLFLLGEELIVHTAHRQKIATNHFRRLRGLIKLVPEFEDRVLAAPKGKGSEAIELVDGRRIEFATRQSGNARGLSADLIVYDEAMFLTEDDRSGITPTMAARSMAGAIQSWYVGSAVDQEDPAQDGVPFAKVREAGLSGAERVALFEWSAPGDDPERVSDEARRDPHVWAQANPGLGKRIALEWVEQERTVEMGARGFNVERLGVGDWPDTSDDAGRVLTDAQWKAIACRDESVRPTGTRTFAVDVNPDRTWGSISVSAMRPDNLWQVALVDRRRGTGWIVERCQELEAEHPGARFAIDAKGPAANLIDDLNEAGLDVIEMDAADYGRACSDFYDGVVNQTIRYPWPQPELDAAVADARKQLLGDAWKWSRRNSTSADITPLVAVTLAHWAAKDAEGGYATVLYGSDHAPQGPDMPEVGVKPPTVLTPEDIIDCFACRVGGCTVHV